MAEKPQYASGGLVKAGKPTIVGDTNTGSSVPRGILPEFDGTTCATCGAMMQRCGSCYTCPNCGANTGCG